MVVRPERSLIRAHELGCQCLLDPYFNPRCRRSELSCRVAPTSADVWTHDVDPHGRALQGSGSREGKGSGTDLALTAPSKDFLYKPAKAGVEPGRCGRL